MSGLRVTALKLPFLSLCLLAVAAITPAHGDVTVVVKEGSDAVLPCSLSTKEDLHSKLFDWKKPAQKDGKNKEVFFYDAGITYNSGRAGQSEEFKDQVFHFQDELRYGNASIIIRNTKVTYSGDYTCDFPRLQPRQTFHIKLVVETIIKDRSGENPAATPKPYTRTLNATEDWVLLQCEAQGASPKPHLQWQDSAGKKLPAEELQTSEREGRHYITLNTIVTKSDLYRCVVTQEGISHQTHEETFVPFCAATPKPFIRIINATVGVLLQCEVRGASPEPHLQWQDSAGNKLPAEEPQVSEREGRHYITLNTIVTKSDLYRCVVTQEEISHQTHEETFVFIRGKVFEDSSSKVAVGWLFGAGVLGAVTVVAALALLVALNRIKILHNRGSPLQEDGLCNTGNGSCNTGNGSSLTGNGSGNGTQETSSKDPSAQPLNSRNV